MRRTSVSLPVRDIGTHDPYDPFEKPARYNSKGTKGHESSLFGYLKTAWMTQSQRYVKTGGVLLFVIFLFYYFSPAGTNGEGRGKCDVYFFDPSSF